MNQTPELWLLIIGVVFIICGMAHELSWLTKWRGTMIQGVVLGMIADDSGESRTYAPEIEYQLDGENRRFTSKYGGTNRLPEGTKVNVWVSQSGKVEWYVFPDRLLFSVAPIICGTGAILCAFGIIP